MKEENKIKENEMKAKPKKIDITALGNEAWDDYRFQNEMLEKYQAKLIKFTNLNFEVEGTIKRIEQYKIQVQLSEGRLVEFCQKNNITMEE